MRDRTKYSMPKFKFYIRPVPFSFTMRRFWPFLLGPCAFSLIIRAFDDGDDPWTATNIFSSENDYSMFDEISNLPSLDPSYPLSSETSSSFQDDAASSDFSLPPSNSDSSTSSCLLFPPSLPPDRRRIRRGGAESACPNPEEGGGSGVSVIDPPMGRIAPAPGGATTQRKTMEEVQQHWCSETSMTAFNNIPICDANFKTSDIFQTPVHFELEGSVPEQGFFNIQKGWPSESSFAHASGFHLGFDNAKVLQYKQGRFSRVSR